MNREPFAAAGGLARANRVFDGALEQIMYELHAGIWEQDEAS